MGILFDAFQHPPQKAIEYLRKRKLQVSGNWYEVWREQHTRAFTVANLTKLGLLQDIRELIRRSIEGEVAPDSTGDPVKRGIPFQEFKKRLRQKWESGELTDRRLRTIYSTNVQTAYMAGRYDGQVKVKNDLPYWQYVAIRDSATTNRCRRLHGLVFRADDPVWDTIYPPNHWGCRSRVRALTDRQVERDNLTVVEDAQIITTQKPVGSGEKRRLIDVKTVKYTGALGQPYAFEPDPGWDYNPGKTSFTPDLSRFDDDIAALWEGQ